MKITKLKTLLTNKILDICECLPKFQNGIIAEYQMIRHFQREKSEEYFESTRLPKNFSIGLKKVVFTELFESENINQLKRGMKKLLPDCQKDNRINKIDFYADKISKKTFGRYGAIARTKEYFPRDSLQIDPDLPEEVDLIDIQIHQIVSSTFLVVFNVHLNIDIQQKILQAHNKKYLPECTLSSLIPFRFRGYTEKSVEAAMENAISKVHYDALFKIEKWITNKIKGYFFYNSSEREGKLPIFEFYHLDGIKYDKETINDEINNNLGKMLIPFGFNFFTPFLYNDESRQMIFPLQEHGYSSKCKGYRLIGISNYKTDYLRYTLDAFVIPLTFNEYFRSIQYYIEKYRLSIFKRTSSQSYKVNINKKDLKNMVFLRKSRMLLDRIEVELKDSKAFFFDMLSPLKDFQPVVTKDENKDLFSTLYSSLLQFRENLIKHLSFLDKIQSDFVAFGNMQMMSQIKRIGLWISIFLGTLSIIINMDKIISVIFDTIGYYNNLFSS